MKKLVYLSLVLLVASCKSSVKTENESARVTSESLKKNVTYLSSDELKGRVTGSLEIDRAATYIEDQFKSYDVQPYFETYRDHFKIKEMDAFNVVGYIQGTDEALKNEFIIIGAHYDHISARQAVGNDSIANGANDNATGTSAVLAIAKYFATKKNNKRSILFALFTAEELGLLGSGHLAERLKTENIDLYTMVNFEMIGVPLINKNYDAFLTGFDRSNMAEKLNTYANQDSLLGASEVAVKYQLFKRSDNYAFYKAFKAPSHTISSCDLTNFDHYHKVGDEAEILDYDFMANLINNTIPAIEMMTNTPTKEIVMYED